MHVPRGSVCSFDSILFSRSWQRHSAAVVSVKPSGDCFYECVKQAFSSAGHDVTQMWGVFRRCRRCNGSEVQSQSCLYTQVFRFVNTWQKMQFRVSSLHRIDCTHTFTTAAGKKTLTKCWNSVSSFSVRHFYKSVWHRRSRHIG